MTSKIKNLTRAYDGRVIKHSYDIGALKGVKSEKQLPLAAAFFERDNVWIYVTYCLYWHRERESNPSIVSNIFKFSFYY
ncbi:hypothetical protein ACFL60_01445 [Candidatus Omnitrophota bacterium]